MGKPGRPKGDNNKDQLFSMRLDERTMRRLNAYCEKMNQLRSTAVRDAINRMLEEEEENETHINAATVIANTVRKEALLLMLFCTCIPTYGPRAIPIDIVNANLLIPSVILLDGKTSLASVIVAEPHTEYTAPM